MGDTTGLAAAALLMMNGAQQRRELAGRKARKDAGANNLLNAEHEAANPDNTLTDMPRERKYLSVNGKAAIDRKYEAKKTRAECKYLAKCEELDLNFGGDHCPKRQKKQQKIDNKHKAKLEQFDQKHIKSLVKAEDRACKASKYGDK